jgi:LmbE family N-acetylglucosaminyl deacetylase
MQLLDELRAAEAREAALRAEIAREMLRLGDRRTACPPPEPPPRPEPPRPTPPPPAPPPAPRQEDADRARREGARSGRVQIILAWDDRNDLDLMMVCPSGERLYFDHRQACGAVLDVDRNAGNSALTPTPVENIVFAAEPAPGRYRIMVWHFQNNPPSPASSPYRVTVKREGRPDQVFTGRVAAGQQVEVGHFDVP